MMPETLKLVGIGLTLAGVALFVYNLFPIYPLVFAGISYISLSDARSQFLAVSLGAVLIVGGIFAYKADPKWFERFLST